MLLSLPLNQALAKILQSKIHEKSDHKNNNNLHATNDSGYGINVYEGDT
jgi:hypothetical protein